MAAPKKKSAWGPLELTALAVNLGLVLFFVLVGLPNSIKEPNTSPANACINTLRQIVAAKEEWALEHGKTNGDVVTVNDLTPYIQLDSNLSFPRCPSGGTYTIGKIGELPTCSWGTNVYPPHVLPPLAKP